MELGGIWLAAQSNDDLRRAVAEPDFDDSGWDSVEVPGHWSSHPSFEGVDGPILYRRRFEATPPEPGERSFLTFDGIFYQGDVWLDGEYVGDTEGYFAPHSFEVTDALRSRTDHVLAVEVACNPPGDRKAKRNLTGVFQHWDCIDPDWNPGGIWGGVGIRRTGPVWIRNSKVLCKEATEDRATLDVEADLDTDEPIAVSLFTALRRIRDDGSTEAEPAALQVSEQDLAAGSNVVRWQVFVQQPDLWWPRALGDQPLYQVEITVVASFGPGAEDAPEDSSVEADAPEVSSVEAGEVSDRVVLTTGLRQIKVRNFIATVNGERLFLKGANYGPTRRALADVTPEEIDRDLRLAADAGLDLIRVHAHIGRPELYEAADREGMLLWQDLPLQWGYGPVRKQAVEQARQAVSLLGHHPSIALWCGHNEPMAVDLAPGTSVAPKTVARVVAAQLLPSYNKTALDRSIRRALERADGSREVIAHSGVVPHPAWGTDSHFYFGWYHGQERDFPKMLSRLPVMARFVSEFGAQAVPESAGWMEPDRWPDLAWEALEAHSCLQKEILDRRVPPGSYRTFDEWRAATQDYQATIIRHHIEALRRLKYRPCGGFCVFMLSDSQPAVTWAVLDHERVPKAGYRAMAAACAPVIITADRPPAQYRAKDRVDLNIHAVSDLRVPLNGVEARVELRWPTGSRTWRFGGDVPADGCVRIGRIRHQLVDAGRGEVSVDLTLTWSGGEALNSYTSRVE